MPVKRLLLSLLLLLTSSVAFGQTATDKIAEGRTALAAHDLVTAQTRFQEALTLAPTNQTAAALLAITRCFALPYTPAAVALLNTLGVAPTGRNPYRWDAPFTSAPDGTVVLPANFNLTALAAFWEGTMVPASEQSRANLAIVTDPNFLITLTTAETGLPTATNFDYADALMLRATLRAAEFLAHFSSGQNVDLNLQTLQPLVFTNVATVQRVLTDNPNFLKVGSLTERTAARTALLDMIALYRQGSAAMRARPGGLQRLFMLELTDLPDEADFRAQLGLIEKSLTEPVDVGDQFFFSGPLFDAGYVMRNALPPMNANGFDFGAVTDPTLGGIVAGMTREGYAAGLSSDPTQAQLGWQWMNPTPHGDPLLRYITLPGGSTWRWVTRV